MVNEAQISSAVLAGVATIGAYAESKGIGNVLTSKLPVSGQMADFGLGLVIALLGFYFDGQWGDYAIAFGIGYALSAVL